MEKAVAEQLLHFCKINNKLYKSQMDKRKFCSAINTITLLIHKVQEVWEG